MKQLVNSQAEVIGIFKTITEQGDDYLCDRTLYPRTVVGVCTIENYDGAVPDARLPEPYAKEIRQIRNQKLIDSDWTQVLDAAVDQTAWATYRQQLRDITAQDDFPFDVTWPEEP